MGSWFRIGTVIELVEPTGSEVKPRVIMLAVLVSIRTHNIDVHVLKTAAIMATTRFMMQTEPSA